MVIAVKREDFHLTTFLFWLQSLCYIHNHSLVRTSIDLHTYLEQQTIILLQRYISCLLCRKVKPKRFVRKISTPTDIEVVFPDKTLPTGT